jgi:hypothetical protein
MNNEAKQLCTSKCMEGEEPCVVYHCRSGEVENYSSIEGGSETYKLYTAQNESFHMYLEEQHPR